MQVGLLFVGMGNDDTFHVTNFLLVFNWYIYNVLPLINFDMN